MSEKEIPTGKSLTPTGPAIHYSQVNGLEEKTATKSQGDDCPYKYTNFFVANINKLTLNFYCSVQFKTLIQ